MLDGRNDTSILGDIQGALGFIPSRMSIRVANGLVRIIYEFYAEPRAYEYAFPQSLLGRGGYVQRSLKVLTSRDGELGLLGDTFGDDLMTISSVVPCSTVSFRM